MPIINRIELRDYVSDFRNGFKNPLTKILKNFEKLLKPSKNTQYWVFFEGFFLSNFKRNKLNQTMKKKSFLLKTTLAVITIWGGA
ncbi:MAG: hypothetical protein ACI9UV_000354 [Algoriphagus sp.]|jgi:hypothetical protein